MRANMRRNTTDTFDCVHFYRSILSTMNIRPLNNDSDYSMHYLFCSNVRFDRALETIFQDIYTSHNPSLIANIRNVKLGVVREIYSGMQKYCDKNIRGDIQIFNNI